MKIKSILLFVIIFFILYIQPLSAGGVKVSFVTIGLIYLYMVSKLIKRKLKGNALSNIGFLIAVKPLFSFGLNNLGSVMLDVIKSLTFPLVILYMSRFFTLEKLRRYLIVFSLILIYASVPFLLKVLSPIKSGYRLSIFGAEDSSGFIGVFENSHSASITLSFCILILIYYSFYVKSDLANINISKYVIYFAIVIGLYVIYKTYVRTGYLTLITGSLYLFFKNFKLKHSPIYIAILIAVGLVVAFLFSTDEVLRNRILDQQQFSTGNEESDIGSGRLVFQLAALHIWSNLSFWEMLFGIGLENFMLNMQSLIGLKIYTHNGFLTALVKDGLIGFILFISYMFLIIKKSFYSKSPDRDLCFSFSISYFFYQLVQGGVISSIMEIILAMVFALLYVKRDNLTAEQINITK
ncbi:O-antigen ligase family protein [Pedobacter psychrodurus]|uniref:O-antigen ligase family protein n=1 Tax=Pedobacter psychrodurus TaxID=2530456 RepID=UPI00292E1340|nr:O-antigen ligase family protein [Pedobacter psychrodurus]